MVFEEADDELIENIKSLAQSVSHIEDIKPSSANVIFGNFEISFGWRKVFCGKQEIPLTRIEFGLLSYFVHNHNRVLTYAQIYKRIWQDIPYGEIRKPICYHIGNLRNKLPRAALRYVSNDQKTDERMYVSGVNCNAKRTYERMTATKKRFGKMGGNVAYHGYQSFQTGEATPEEAHKIGLETARRMWGNEYEVVVTTHLNTDNVHNHFVVNSVSFQTSRKFKNHISDHHKLREISDAVDAMSLNDCTPSHAQSICMKKHAQQNILSLDGIYEIMSEEKANQTERISFKVQDLRGFFPKNFTQKQMTDTILKLLYKYNRKLERRRNSRDER